MNLKKSQKEYLQKLKKAEELLYSLSNEVGALRDEIEMPLMLKEIKSAIKKSKNLKITTSWIQRKYKLGYARSARLMDLLVQKKKM